MRNFCIKEMLGFKGDAVKNFQNPYYFFGHNLVITYPN